MLLFRKVRLLENFVTVEVERVTHDKLLPISAFLALVTQEPFYADPIFHVSLFKLKETLSEEVLAELEKVGIEPKKSFVLSECVLKAGNKEYTI